MLLLVISLFLTTPIFLSSNIFYLKIKICCNSDTYAKRGALLSLMSKFSLKLQSRILYSTIRNFTLRIFYHSTVTKAYSITSIIMLLLFILTSLLIKLDKKFPIKFFYLKMCCTGKYIFSPRRHFRLKSFVSCQFELKHFISKCKFEQKRFNLKCHFKLKYQFKTKYISSNQHFVSIKNVKMLLFGIPNKKISELFIPKNI